MRSLPGLHFASAGFPVDGAPRLTSVNASVKRIRVEPDQNSRLVFLTEPAGLAVERYKILRRRICTLYPHGGAVLITSSSIGEGKTLTSINLACSLADAGRDTCLVDLDFRAPGVLRTLGCEANEDGVDAVLTGKRMIRESMIQLAEPPLYVLGVRNRLVSPGHLLSSAPLAVLLAELRSMFQWIIIDFAPVVPMADVAEVITHIDGALMVVRTGKTDKSLIPPALEILGSKLWGVVANDSPINGSSYYSRYGTVRD
jgi:capsular exopolysaccharide synthesis family protein